MGVGMPLVLRDRIGSLSNGCVYADVACEHDTLELFFAAFDEFGDVSHFPHLVGVAEVQVPGVNDSAIVHLGDDGGAPCLELVKAIGEEGVLQCHLS